MPLGSSSASSQVTINVGRRLVDMHGSLRWRSFSEHRRWAGESAAAAVIDGCDLRGAVHPSPRPEAQRFATKEPASWKLRAHAGALVQRRAMPAHL